MSENSFFMSGNSFFAGVIFSTIISTSSVLGVRSCREIKNMPNDKEVQQGYVIPNQLEIEVQDLDRNGQNEVLMRYKGISYLLKVDEQGKPSVQSYEVKPY